MIPGKESTPGMFVAFEGGDGAGKSTQVDLLVSKLQGLGHEVVKTREPGGTPLGLGIRTLLLDPQADVVPKAEALLFAADRAQHVAQVIRPALERGAFVVSDRFLVSSIAYQGFGRGLGERQIEQVSQWATDDLTPDLTILLQITPEVGLQRAKDSNRMEQQPLAFHQAVAKGFEEHATAHPSRFLVLDASQDVQALATEIFTQVMRKFDQP